LTSSSALPASPDGMWHYMITCMQVGGVGGWSTGYANRDPVLSTHIPALTADLSVRSGITLVITGISLLAGPASVKEGSQRR